MTQRPTAVLVTGHYLKSRRRAGFHGLAHALRDLGFDVTMLTTGLSRLSAVRGDHRMSYDVRAERGRLVEVEQGLRSFVWFTPWHPGNLRAAALNRLATPLFSRYARLPLGAARGLLDSADVVLFDTSPGLMLAPGVMAANPSALVMLRASDDLRAMNAHPVLLDTDRRIARHFDLVSVPSPGVAQRYAACADPFMQLHGIDRARFDAPSASPYHADPRVHAVFVGNVDFDHQFLGHARREAPWAHFHIIGPISGVVAGDNVTVYGELDFAATVPFLVHADIGLHTLAESAHSATFSDSLKTRQYAYCGLPIVSPEHVRRLAPGTFSYRADDPVSVRSALESARDARPVPQVPIDDWKDVAAALVDEGLRRRAAAGRPISATFRDWELRTSAACSQRSMVPALG